MLAKDSNELLDYALRELQVAVKKDRPKVEIFLEECCVKNTDSIEMYSLKLEEITEKLRDIFKGYKITTTVKVAQIKPKKVSKKELYPLIWILTLRKKK